jgi:hypothetical protein
MVHQFPPWYMPKQSLQEPVHKIFPSHLQQQWIVQSFWIDHCAARLPLRWPIQYQQLFFRYQWFWSNQANNGIPNLIPDWIMNSAWHWPLLYYDLQLPIIHLKISDMTPSASQKHYEELLASN